MAKCWAALQAEEVYTSRNAEVIGSREARKAGRTPPAMPMMTPGRMQAKLLATLNHPNIATIHGLQEANGQQFIVMELVEGETLADRIAGGPIPLHEALPIAGQVAGIPLSKPFAPGGVDVDVTA